MHEWSASLNERELTPVLPSNRETGCLSDTWIKMDALYFLPCSVREQGETKDGVKGEEEEKKQRHTCRGHDGKYKKRVCERKTKGTIHYALSYALNPVIKANKVMAVL